MGWMGWHYDEKGKLEEGVKLFRCFGSIIGLGSSFGYPVQVE